MRHLLTPITMILWFLTAYYGFYYGIILMIWMFNLNWIWLIIGFPFLIGIIFGITNGLPSILKFLILKFYGINWFTVVAHSIAGLIGVIMIFIFYKNHPIEFINGKAFNLTEIWNE